MGRSIRNKTTPPGRYHYLLPQLPVAQDHLHRSLQEWMQAPPVRWRSSAGPVVFRPFGRSQFPSWYQNNIIMIMIDNEVLSSYHILIMDSTSSPFKHLFRACLFFMSETHVKQSRIGSSGSSKSHTDWPPNHRRRQKPEGFQQISMEENVWQMSIIIMIN